MDNTRVATIGPQGEHGNCYGKGETTRSSAARIDEENLVKCFELGLMGMARDYHAEAGSHWIEVELREVVKNIKGVRADFDGIVSRQAESPGVTVVIATNRTYWS